MPVVILHHLLNVSLQLANKRGLKKIILDVDLEEVGWGDVDWIGLAQDWNRWGAVVNSVLNLRVP
jgi:hypothetical protein